MSKGVNKVFLLGSVGKDPEIRATAGGTTVANFSLATSDRKKSASGEWEDSTEWHNLVAFQRTAEVVRDYVKKGTQLHIEGKIQTRSWDDKTSGEKKYRTEIIVDELSLLGTNSGGGQKSQSRSSAPARREATAPAARSQAPAQPDDDIPF